MAIPQQFLDRLRERTTLSAVIGRSLKLTKAGREFKACCPFHGEKTPSFTVNDDKGFAHCFGCQWHGDAIEWLTQHDGLGFIEAVQQLASAAGLDVPAPTPERAAREARAATVREALDRAQAIYRAQLDSAGAVMEYLAKRGIGPAEVEAFGLGFARGGDGSLRGSGIGQQLGQEAGLLVPRTDDQGLREQFWDRITVPIHDARGQLAGFAGRVWPGRRTQEPKFVNSPQGPLFDKGRLLFNLHRAAPLARPASAAHPEGEGRLIVVEGYFDVIALARIGIGAAVAPMGTALTEAQLELAWRRHQRPVLLFDGDKAGLAAALRACRTALPQIAPGRGLAVALLPGGKDPDDLVRELGPEAAAREIGAVLQEARGIDAFLFETVRTQAGRDGAGAGPEGIAAVWHELAELAGAIRDDETRAQYLALWRARFDREVSAVPMVAPETALHAATPAEAGDYAFPESEGDSAKRLIAIVRAKLRKRAEIAAIRDEIKDIDGMAKAIGFDTKAINAVIRDIESDLAHGPAAREDAEMVRVLYRRTLGIRGPMNEAMLPQLVDARPRQVTQATRRRMTVGALIDASGGAA